VLAAPAGPRGGEFSPLQAVKSYTPILGRRIVSTLIFYDRRAMICRKSRAPELDFEEFANL
jgi:hypothetical protein